MSTVTCTLPSSTQSNETLNNKNVCFKTRTHDLSYDMLMP